MILDYVALAVIFFLLIGLTAAIVALGSLPGNIARKRGHPWPDAVNAASLIGLATGIFWPIAFIWAFLPLPAGRGGAAAKGSDASVDVGSLQTQLAALEETVAKLQSQTGNNAS